MGKVLRRHFLIRGTQMLSAVTLVPVIARAQQCVELASEELRESLNYQDPGPEPNMQCKDCGFFEMKNAPCGYCQIMTGPVSATAHCDSWSSAK